MRSEGDDVCPIFARDGAFTTPGKVLTQSADAYTVWGLPTPKRLI